MSEASKRFGYMFQLTGNKNYVLTLLEGLKVIRQGKDKLDLEKLHEGKKEIEDKIEALVERINSTK